MPLMLPLAAVIGIGAYTKNKIEKNYPPQSDAPKIGEIVTKTFPDGSTKEYRVVTRTGHDLETCKKIQTMLENKEAEKPLYHSPDDKVTQSYARSTGAVATIGIDPAFENVTAFELSDQRYENSGFFPLDPDALNGKLSYQAPGPLHDKKPDLQVVKITKVTPENQVGFIPSFNRMWHAGKSEEQL